MAKRVYTPNAIAVLRRMAEEGHSASTIAEKIGSTPSSVRVMCSHFKIRLGQSKQQNGHPTFQHTKQGCQQVVAYMPGPLYTNLDHKAVHLNKSVSVLVGMLLEAIVTGDLYDAVLDERD